MNEIKILYGIYSSDLFETILFVNSVNNVTYFNIQYVIWKYRKKVNNNILYKCISSIGRFIKIKL